MTNFILQKAFKPDLNTISYSSVVNSLGQKPKGDTRMPRWIIRQRESRMLLFLDAVQTWAVVQTWLLQLKILISVSKFEPALNWNRFFAVQRRG